MRLVESSVRADSNEVNGFDKRGVLQEACSVLIVLFRCPFFIRVYVWLQGLETGRLEVSGSHPSLSVLSIEGVFRLCCI